MLIDTCILIDHFRGDAVATRFLLENENKMKICSITDMEISQGVRNKTELRVYDKLLQQLSIQIVDLNEEISVKARLWVRAYGLSHGLYLADALIAATASVYGYQLISLNKKDFQYLDIPLSSI
jgi:predicted nucleic acid-binding protein